MISTQKIFVKSGSERLSHLTRVTQLIKPSLSLGLAVLQCGPAIYPFAKSFTLERPGESYVTWILPLHKTTDQLECKKYQESFKEIVCPYRMCVLCCNILLAIMDQALFFIRRHCLSCKTCCRIKEHTHSLMPFCACSMPRSSPKCCPHLIIK